jgi:hypothetical protein
LQVFTLEVLRSLALSYNLECFIGDPHSIPPLCVPLMIIRKDILLFFPQAVPTSKGQALADEYGIKFFETVSANMLLEWNRHSFIYFLFSYMQSIFCRVLRQI